jgi:hypothetical protein
MRWVQSSNGTYFLAVLPLHGKGNSNGTGQPVNMLVFKYPDLLRTPDPAYIISTGMHMTHNLEITVNKGSRKQHILIAGKEGLGFIDADFTHDSKVIVPKNNGNYGAGEVRAGAPGDASGITATIEPMHGNNLAIYTREGQDRVIVDSTLSEGHGLLAADLLGLGHDQVVAGWRRPGKDGMVGVKLYKKNNTSWEHHWIDKNDMACEDLQVMDLNADGKLDIVASGRSTHNLKIYWNISRSRR